ncbi:minor capsid protein [Klebsiella grimontii]|uniref:minor capsid protein n=1 Tax=Klebsiella grimontii TaxID=2058152 RepID=UPI002115A961|nr:minor capsid protein [Klebsiella grimontii]
MFVEGLALYLAGKGVGKVGSTIFADAMPQDAKSAVMVTSPTSGIEVDHELSGFYMDSMLIVVRDASLSAAQRKMQAVSALLPVEDVESGGAFFKMLRPMTLPVVYPRNDGAMFEIGLPVEFAGYML